VCAQIGQTAVFRVGEGKEIGVDYGPNFGL
jgi:hypothetical protein